MYDELVKRLREYAKEHCPRNGEYGICGCIDAREAADAIEELQQTAEHYKGCSDDWYKEACDYKAMMPHWIPVPEKLPDAYEDVLLQFPNNQAAGFIDRGGCWGVYSGDGFYTEVADNETKPTHWARKLPEPPKEEA